MPAHARDSTALWLCLYCPKLALNAVQAQLEAPDLPFAVLVPNAKRAVVLDANPAAEAYGVRAGQTLAQARARLNQLRAFAADQSGQARLLETLACLSYQFSHQVHLMQQAVALEIGGSLQFFAGLEKLLSQLTTMLKRLDITLCIGIAPNPQAAWVMARAAKVGHTHRAKQFPEALFDIPIANSAIALDVQQALVAVGVEKLGTLLALPRANLQRRYGRDFIHDIERLLGERAHTAPRWQPPERFIRELEFAFNIEQTQSLRFPLRRLLQELALFLGARDGGLQEFTLHLKHRDLPSTEVKVGLLSPTREPALMIELAEQKLDQLALPAAVIGLGVMAHALPPLVQHTADLFDPSANASVPLPKLLERLQGKLGPQSVRLLGCKADHRPECASVDHAIQHRGQLPTTPSVPPSLAARPIWLKTPEPISPADFEIQSGPERIESGWWEQDCIRDYYQAKHRDGRLIWLYQPRHALPGTWFWQGSW